MNRTNWLYFFLCFCALWSQEMEAQSSREGVAITQILDSLSSQFNVQFNYKSDLLNGVRVTTLSRKRTLKENLKNLELETALQFTKVGASVYIITRPITICGYLKDVETTMPLGNATVRGEMSNVVSDANGYFELKVASVNEILEIRHLGFKTISRKVGFFNTTSCAVIPMYEEGQQLSTIVLTDYLVRGIDKKGDGTTLIDFSKFTTLPGLIETDVLYAAQSLPGIMSIDETVSNINIRGGSHDQNLILWDDIKMYQAGHFFGLISSFNPQITKTAAIITNGSDASYTDGVSGTIEMKTETTLQKDFSGGVGVNFISTDIFTDIPIGEHASLQIAGRRSIDDILRTPTYDVYFDRVTQETEIDMNDANVTNSNQDFDFYDTSLRWLYHPTQKDRLRFNIILISNNLDFDETSSTSNVSETRTSSLSQNSLGFGLAYDRDWSENFKTQIAIYNTDYKLNAINADVVQQQRFFQENSVSETSVKIKSSYLWDKVLLQAGYQFTETEVVNVNDIDVPRFLRRDSEVLRENAIFFQAYFQNDTKSFSMRPGGRLSYIDEFDSFIFEPRLSLRKRITKELQVELLGEFKHQNTSQIINFQNDFLGIEKRRWQLTDNDTIPIIKSKQVSLGLQYTHKGLLLDATSYVKEISGITTQSQGFTTKYEFIKTDGSYTVFGLDFLIRKQFKNLSSWLSYSYMDNRYQFENLPEQRFPSNFDVTHALVLGTTYSNNVFNASAGLNYRTGKPTTQPLDGNEVVDGEINFDVANSSRIQDFFRVDLSAVYKLRLSPELRSEIGASIWNVLNTRNQINHYYRLDSTGDPRKFTRESLGLTSNVMVRFYF